ncbi:hypothetical protein [Pseudomonas typographi]|uniref:Uncharacterized protein n=1 Tax=Pseudomonas typographi TaxID=2715964 RepID=A0ABR7YZS5_9PSED|nr:hypothetical protein [Pseudomonas typographi]MBD1550627.1 hypothetical protein [Pseudomonas typographi]MBD1586788.1 hypothetical protein [Pseudomonas typographi]MBD1598682.1 hypothetical protein [Pseudomonas typographi]
MLNTLPVKNPLAIIAIFAGMIEASALASLPLLDHEGKRLYVWFLIGFPPFLTLLFFVTLNFNHRALYAPDETPTLATPAVELAGSDALPAGPRIRLDHRADEAPDVVLGNISQALALLQHQSRRTPGHCCTLVVVIQAAPA